MKKQRFNRYFTDRFSRLRAKLRPERKLPDVLSCPSHGEFEVLETRLLLSGIGTGLDQKRVQFTDLDGDLVTVSARGEGASFDIRLVGGVDDGADIESITIKGQGASLGVSVAPQGFETGTPTPGLTNVGEILAAGDVTEIGSVSLSAAVVARIDLGDAGVGSISLTTGQAAKVDALTFGGVGGVSSLAQISFQDISTGSVDSLRLAGASSGQNNFEGDVAVTTGDIGQLWGPNSTMFGDLHFGGADAALGSVNLGGGFYYGTQITAAGNFTFLADGFYGSIAVDGHLNFGVGEGGVYGDIHAGGGVSGLKASTTDEVLIGGWFSADLSTAGDIADLRLTGGGYFDYAIVEAVNIGTIKGRSDGSGIGYGNIFRASGDLEGIELRRSGLGYGNIIDVSGQIGSIDIIYGNIDGQIMAGSFGDVRVSYGSIYGSLVALSGDIGSVEVKEGSIYGSIQALQGGIGSVTALTSLNYSAIGGKITALGAGGIGDVSATNLGDGLAIGGYGSLLFSAADIGKITAISNGSTAIGGEAFVQAAGDVESVKALSLYAGTSYSAAIADFNLQAASIGSIEASSVAGQGIAYSSLTAINDIGPVSVTSRTGGILYSEFKTYKGSIGGLSIVDLAPDNSIWSTAVYGSFFNAAGNIGPITVISEGGGFYYSGVAAGGFIGNIYVDAVRESVYGSDFQAQLGIGDMTLISRGAFGSATYTSVVYSTFQAQSGAIGNIAISSAGDGVRDSAFGAATSIGRITAISTSSYGYAVAHASFSASQGNLGDVFVSSGNAGIYESDFTAAGNIGNVTVETGGIAIGGTSGYNYGSLFTAGGSIGNISATSNGVDGMSYAAIYNAVFEAKSNIGNISAISAGDGIASSRFLAGGNIGDISAVAKGNPYYGYHATAISGGFVAQGSIGNISATSYAGIGINFAWIEAGLDIGNVTVVGLGGVSDVSGLAAVQYSLFNAKAGSIGTIDITSVDKVVYYSTFQAHTDIGDVNLRANSQGPMPPQDHTVAELTSFSAATGNIGDIVLSSKLGAGAVYSNFKAGGNIGSLDVDVATEGLSYTDFEAGGSIGSVSIVSNGHPYYSSAYTAVYQSDIKAAGNIGNINVQSVGEGVRNAYFGSGGSIGNVTVSTEGVSYSAAVYTAISYSTLDAHNSIGNVTVSSAGGGIYATDFNALHGSIGNVTVAAGGTGIGAGAGTGFGSAFVAGGNIGSITVDAYGVGVYTASFRADGSIGATSIVSSSYSAVIDGHFQAGANLGNITIASAGDGVRDSFFGAGGFIGKVSVIAEYEGFAATTFKAASIAAISIDAGTNSRVTVNADSVGSITSSGNFVGWAALTLDLGKNTAAIGNVSILTNLEIVGDTSALDSLGMVSVGGTLSLGSSLAVTSLGGLSAASVNTSGPITIGAGAGAFTGAIAVTSQVTGGTSQNVTFDFATFSSAPVINGTALNAASNVGNFFRL